MEISQIEVSVDEVMERLSELDTTKACGPDKIPARLACVPFLITL